jgi:redox-sensitive bicupin YhaK (pirin superfamily)
MIHIRRSSERHHDRRRQREVWRTFDPIARTDGPSDRFGPLEAVDESRLPPRANVPRRVTGDAEVITYVRAGAIAYDDSTGHAGVIHAGEFQRMLTVHGARHSEANASRIEWAHVFQIRLSDSAPELQPGREQKRFSAAERRGLLCLIASSDARSGSLRLGQNTRIYSALLEPGQHVVHELAPDHAAWLHVVQGAITFDNLVLLTGDSAGITAERAVSLTTRETSEIMLFDVTSADRAVHDLQARHA